MDKYLGEYDVIVTADHGGHERMHGTAEESDMIIPIFFAGNQFEKGKSVDGITILDIAPTVTKLLGINADQDWEGKALI